MNCSSGDLAHIIKSVDGLMVGRTVQCIALDLPNHTLLGPIWNVRSSDDLVSEYGVVGKNMHVPDAWLKKIQPPPLPNKVKQKELVE
jgi:hypothetical protein